LLTVLSFIGRCCTAEIRVHGSKIFAGIWVKFPIALTLFSVPDMSSIQRIINAQTKVLKAAIKGDIPSDFSTDFTKRPEFLLGTGSSRRTVIAILDLQPSRSCSTRRATTAFAAASASHTCWMAADRLDPSRQ
jgi:hypothetical protein